MILKVYGMLWAMLAVTAGIIFLIGNFTQMTAIIFGFICFGMIFLGMISVLPSTVVHHEPRGKPQAMPVPQPARNDYVPANSAVVH